VTTASEPPDPSQNIDEFLKIHWLQLEIDALKLAKVYSLDLNELLSRTQVTIWQNWEITVQSLEESARRGYARTTLANHARNLNRLRHKQHEELRSFSDEDIHDISGATSAWRDPAVEIVFRDGELMIYRAIAHLQGKQKDVMALIALGWDHRSISDQLQMSDTHVKSTLHRARIVLREILAATFGTAND